MKQALSVIDVQNDYFAGGKMALTAPEQALQMIQQLEADFIARRQPIVYIQHIKPNPQADFFARGSRGAELHPDLAVNEDSLIIQKQFANSFLKTELQTVLQQLQIEQLVIVGMMTQMCVDSTTRAAAELGYQPILIADATATNDLTFANQLVPASQVAAAFLAALSNFAQVLPTNTFLAKS